MEFRRLICRSRNEAKSAVDVIFWESQFEETANSSDLVRREFFFQAEDGIRDIGVTGVQTCALPILQGRRVHGHQHAGGVARRGHVVVGDLHLEGGDAEQRAGRSPDLGGEVGQGGRSEERRVGEEGRSWWLPYLYKKK